MLNPSNFIFPLGMQSSTVAAKQLFGKYVFIIVVSSGDYMQWLI